MPMPAQRPMTADEFIGWAMEQPQGERYELVAGTVVAMAPERLAHARTKGLVYRALADALRAKRLPCEALPDGMAVVIDDATVYEPDALVRCGPTLPPDTVQLNDPMIVVEVLSPSTQARDAGAKLADYFRLPSVRHYLIVDIGTRTVIHHHRGDDEHIQTKIVRSQEIMLDPPGIKIAITDFFS